jgi:hypothetical protein
MGDNVTFNDGLAQELGVLRGKCLSHAESLVAEAALAPFKELGLYDLVIKAGGIISAGGTTKRKAELSGPSFSLAPSKMLVYENRFGSALIANRYRLRNFNAVKRWHLEGKTLELAPANDGAAAADKMQKQASAAAYRNPHAQLVMQIVDDMYGDVPGIVELLGGNGDQVDPSIINKLVRQRMLYATLEKDPSKLISAACGKCDIAPSAAILTKYTSACKASASAAADKWDKHFIEPLSYLRRRFFYTISNMPVEAPQAAIATTAAAVAFYGCYDEDATVALDLEYAEYVSERRSHRDNNPASWAVEPAPPALPGTATTGPAAERYRGIPFVRYWEPASGAGSACSLSPGDNCHMFLRSEDRVTSSSDYWRARRNKWPTLSKVASFWIEFETSSIAAERVFAIIRRMGLSGRGSMGHDTFRHEIFFRVNRDALLQLVEAKRKSLDTFMREAIARSKAGAGASAAR